MILLCLLFTEYEVITLINISSWVNLFTEALAKYFGNRVWFVGLQGSYGRGEATESSDIDMVVILDTLTAADIPTYHAMLDTLPHRNLICGFLSGKEEILHWEPADLFQFYYDTTPIIGSLDPLLDVIDPDSVNRAIKIGACNIFHGCVHNMLYEKSAEIIRGLYKTASFVVQAICFQQTGVYTRCLKDLLEIAASGEQQILGTFLELKNGGGIDFHQMSEALLHWSQSWINRLE